MTKVLCDIYKSRKKDEAYLYVSRKDGLTKVPEELYDYQNDPDALRNLAGNPDYNQLLNDRRARLLAHMEQTGDPQLDHYRQQITKSSKANESGN